MSESGGVGVTLVERDADLSTLWQELRAAQQRAGRVVLVSGEAGIGKSTLVRRFCEEAGTRTRVLWGACDANITPRPLGPLLDIAAGNAGELADLVRRSAPPDELFEVFRSSLAGRPVPTVVVIEDVHWIDEATLDLLRFLVRRIEQARSLVLLTYRDDELTRDHPLRLLLGDLATSPLVTRLQLGPLSPDGVAALAGGRDLDVAALHALTGGNPFFVTEVLASGDGGTGGLPATVRDAVLARAAGLPADARAAVDVVALARPPVPVALVTAVSGASPSAVDAAVAAGVLVTAGTGLSFRHELARRVTEENVPPGRTSELHSAVLDWLIAQPSAHPSELAHHAEGAGDRTAVLRHAPAAAVHASGLGAHREAAAQYARALRWADGLPADELVPLLEAHSLESMIADDIEPAVASRARAVQLRRGAGDRVALGDSLRWFSRVLWVAGRNAEAEAAGLEALELLRGEPPCHVVGMAYSNQSQLAMLARDLEGAVRYGERAIEIAESCGDVEAMVHALNNVGTALYWAGETEAGRDKLERSLEMARSAGLHDHAARALCNLGSGTGELREYEVAEPFLVEGLSFCDDHQQDYFGHYLESWLARCRFEQGHWEEAEHHAWAVLDRPAVAAVTRIVALTVLGRLGVRRGERGEHVHLEEAWELADGTGDLQRTWPVAAGRAEAAWLAGDIAGIELAVRGPFEHAVRIGHEWGAGELGYWLVRSGHLDRLPSCAAEPYRLMVEGDPGAAAAAWADIGCPYERALALSLSDDEAELRAGFAVADELGAAPLAAALAQALRERGVRLTARRPTPRSDHPLGLTARQVEVLHLVAEGMKDAEIAGRLFISTKTVGHHVSAILAKLEVSSRSEAIAEAHRLGLIGVGAST